MAKKKGLFMNKKALESVIDSYCVQRKETELRNPLQGLYTYYLSKDDCDFELNVYFRSDNTITVTPCGGGISLRYSQTLKELIYNSVEYKDVDSGSFTASISQEQFNGLVNFLENSEGINKKPKDGATGEAYRFETDFGDVVTLTYFNTTSKMLYQGRLMKLYAIIKSYIQPLGKQVLSSTQLGSQSLEDKVEQALAVHLPIGHNKIEQQMRGFIKDSFILAEAGTALSDYASWVMQSFRVLEYQIKKVCLDHSVIIEDSSPFHYYKNPGVTNKRAPVFIIDEVTKDVIGVNTSITTLPITAQKAIIECYDFLRKNRHELFHTTQIILGIKLLSTQEEAKALLVSICDEIEKTFTY